MGWADIMQEQKSKNSSIERNSLKDKLFYLKKNLL